MSFLSWLFLQRYRCDLVGEFAEQVTRRNWIATEDLQVLRVRLTLEKASPVAVRALHLSFEEWQGSKHLPAITVFPTRVLPQN